MLLLYARGATGRSAELRKRHLKILAIVLLTGAAAYASGGFLIAPRIVKYWIEHSIATEPGKRLGVESVNVNPFTRFMSLTNVTLIDEKNKPIISIDRIETRFKMLERLRISQPGYDVKMRDLRVTDPSTGEVIWTIPNLSVTDLVVNAAQGTVRLSAARLENPDFHIMRDSSGTLHLPGWLRLPQDGSPPAAFLFDRLEVNDGKLRFTDQALSPSMKSESVGIVGTITRRRSAGTESMAVRFEGRFGATGSGEVIAEWGPPQQQTPTIVNLALRRVDLPTVSPYFAQIAGLRITAGTGDLTLNYEQRAMTTRIDGRIDVDRLQLSDDIATDTSIATPLHLAAALTTDDTGHIDLSIPILQSGADADPDAAIVDSITDYVSALAATPFTVLAVLVGRKDEELGKLAFPPGSAEITAITAEKIKLLARALSRRPLLALRANPTYDATADRNAIAAQQVNLHIRLATSAGLSGLSTQTTIDFEDPKVRMILDEFAGARLPEARQLAISRRYEGKDVAYYQAVHDALVANDDVSETVLRRLARFRARSVVGALAESGVDEKRLLLADAIETTASDSNDVVVRLDALPLQ